MKLTYRRVLIIADIEGSSDCWDYEGSSWLTPAWRRACRGMTRDVAAVVRAVLDAGAEDVRVKDFHRTGYNLLSEWIDPRARVIQGYRPGPVPGIGDPGRTEAAVFLGMHAASGTRGFLAHTLTSRLAALRVNDRPMTELELFAASLAPFGIRPAFFSGCPTACDQARAVISGLPVFPIDKSDGPGSFRPALWRRNLAEAAVRSIQQSAPPPYEPAGPFKAEIVLRDGPQAVQKIADRWGVDHDTDRVFLSAPDIHTLYADLIRLCYLTPTMERAIRPALSLYRLMGRLGLIWVRRRLRPLPPPCGLTP